MRCTTPAGPGQRVGWPGSILAHRQFRQGTWMVVATEKDGQPLDRLKGGTLVIKDQDFTITTASGSELKGGLRLDPSKKPMTMDLAHTEGLLQEKTWQAIYELGGDDLKMCYAEADSNKGRPSEFATARGSGLLLVTLKREKK